MSVATLSRYKTERDYIETVMKHSHAIRDAVVELGAERLVIGQALAGQYTGDWVTMIRAKDMARWIKSFAPCRIIRISRPLWGPAR